jgi:hypothetical protein
VFRYREFFKKYGKDEEMEIIKDEKARKFAKET